MQNKTYDAKSLCDELFNIVAKTIKAKLTPAVMELFKASSVDTFSAIDLNRLATNIFPYGTRRPAEYVFHYEKSFVHKTDRNLKKTSNLQNDVQLLTNKLNVSKRELQSNSKNFALLKENLAALTVDKDLRFKKLKDQMKPILDDGGRATPTSESNPIATCSELAKLKDEISHLNQTIQTNSATCHDRHDGVEQYTRPTPWNCMVSLSPGAKKQMISPSISSDRWGYRSHTMTSIDLIVTLRGDESKDVICHRSFW